MFDYSIIIPHYNIPKLLLRCVKSIPERDDVQIIVVDDCSPENVDLINIFQQLHNRKNLEIYRTVQGGSAGRARNVGVNHAVGKWIIFADADDFFDKKFTKLLNDCVNASEDLIYFRCRSVMSEDVNVKSNRISDDSKYFITPITPSIENHFRIEMQVPWGKIIKRELIVNNNIRFDETRYANDAMFAVLAGCKASSIKIMDINAYVLTDRQDSLCANFFRKPGEAGIRLKVALRVNKVINQHGYNIGLNDEKLFIKLALINHDYSAIRDILLDANEYGIKKSDLLRSVKESGKRYYPIYLWLSLLSWS